jgi:hypothetical protein
MIKKHKFNCPVVVKKLPDYKNVNTKLLEYFDTCDHEEIKNLTVTENYYPDSFNKLDFYNSSDFDRPWVQFFLPYLKKELKEIANFLWYDDFIVNCIWFQEYLRGNHHGWHIHGDNFTGVYYLEFPEGCSKTEVCSPYDSKVIQVDAVEGDFIVFPSHYLHRGLPNKKIRKTIVSFNFDITSYTEPN